MTMDPDTLSGSIVVLPPTLFHMTETFERNCGEAGLTPAQCALIRASLNKARMETDRLIHRADAVTEMVLNRLSRRSAQGAQDAPREDGSSRA